MPDEIQIGDKVRVVGSTSSILPIVEGIVRASNTLSENAYFGYEIEVTKIIRIHDDSIVVGDTIYPPMQPSFFVEKI